MIYFTSDLHFGHKNIVRLTGENFSSTEERDNVIITNWNKKVKKKDIVYVLGDISWRNTEETCEIFKKLNGKIYIIKGNHDKYGLLKALYEQDLIEEWYDYLKLCINKKQYILFHYPIEEWDNYYRGSAMLHGHLHSNNLINSGPPIIKTTKLENGEEFDRITSNVNRFDVGVNACNYTPISIDEIDALLTPVKENQKEKS